MKTLDKQSWNEQYCILEYFDVIQVNDFSCTVMIFFYVGSCQQNKLN